MLSVDTDRVITAVNPEDGVFQMQAGAVVLAMGCRERSRGAIGIAGTRPAGIFTAGTAQRFVNMEGYMPGKKVVILGSGDIGLIMARRMSLEGARVEMVLEAMPFSGGLKRNIGSAWTISEFRCCSRILWSEVCRDATGRRGCDCTARRNPQTDS